jgi:hypothetical protein
MDDTTTMDVVHDAIIAAFRDRFADRIVSLGAYEPINQWTKDAEEKLETPALLLELAGFRVAEDDQHQLGRLACDCSWAMHCELSPATPKLQQTMAQLSAAVVSLILPPITTDDWTRGNLWGLDTAVDPPRSVSAQPSTATIWRVTWEQTIYLDQELPA